MDEPVEIDYQEAKRIMDSAEYRLKTNPPDFAYNKEWNEPEIFHDGKWKSLCRTDLCDDVATGMCANKTLEQWIAHYKKKLRRWTECPSARYDDHRFSVIDAITDG